MSRTHDQTLRTFAHSATSASALVMSQSQTRTMTSVDPGSRNEVRSCCDSYTECDSNRCGAPRGRRQDALLRWVCESGHCPLHLRRRSVQLLGSPGDADHPIRGVRSRQRQLALRGSPAAQALALRTARTAIRMAMNARKTAKSAFRGVRGQQCRDPRTHGRRRARRDADRRGGGEEIHVVSPQVPCRPRHSCRNHHEERGAPRSEATHAEREHQRRHHDDTAARPDQTGDDAGPEAQTISPAPLSQESSRATSREATTRNRLTITPRRKVTKALPQPRIRHLRQKARADLGAYDRSRGENEVRDPVHRAVQRVLDHPDGCSEHDDCHGGACRAPLVGAQGEDRHGHDHSPQR